MFQNKSQIISRTTRTKFAAINTCLVALVFLIHWLANPLHNFANIYAEIYESVERLQEIWNTSGLQLLDRLITLPLFELRSFFFGILTTYAVFFSAYLLAPQYFSAKNSVGRFFSYVMGLFFINFLFYLSVLNFISISSNSFGLPNFIWAWVG